MELLVIGILGFVAFGLWALSYDERSETYIEMTTREYREKHMKNMLLFSDLWNKANNAEKAKALKNYRVMCLIDECKKAGVLQ